MKKDLTSLDIHFLLSELQALKGAKIDKIFQKDCDFLFQVHIPSAGKKFLRVILPGLIFLTEEKEERETTDNFALSLRKHISNSRIKEVRQLEFERIIEISLESKANHRLFIELFSPGNIILCDESLKIIMAYTYKGFGARMIRPSAIYEYPKKEYNFLAFTELDLKGLFEKSEKNSIVVTLATNLGLGGQYAEELLHMAGIEKKDLSIKDKDIKKLYHAIENIRKKQPAGYVYELGGNITVSPFELTCDGAVLKEKTDSFNISIEKSGVDTLKVSAPKENKHKKEKEKLDAIIKSQEMRIAGLEKSAEESQKKGEAIYENYSLVKKLLEDLLKAKEKFSWKEIKEKLKGHRYVKDIIEKDKKVVLEL